MKHWINLLLCILIHPIYACEDDPFGASDEDVFGKPIVPREAFYQRESASKTRVELIVRSLPILPVSFENLALTNRDLAKIPHTNEEDEVYELSGIFPNCKKENKNLWVVCNATSCLLIANADPLLRTSVSEYVHSTVDRLPKKMKLSITYLKVPRNTSLKLESLQKSRHKKISSFSGEFRSGEDYKWSQGKLTMMIQPIIKWNERHMHLSLSLDSDSVSEIKNKVEVKLDLAPGKATIVEAGIDEGDEKRVMIINYEMIDLLGATVGYRQARRQEVASPIIDIRFSPFRVEELINLMSDGTQTGRLIVTPELPMFKTDDVVYDLTELFEDQGIDMTNGYFHKSWIISNITSNKLYCNCDHEALKLIKELMMGFGPHPDINFTAEITFYEVDA